MPQQQHGTATYTLGHYNEVHVALTRALPKALEGTDPKRTIWATTQSPQCGTLLEQTLHRMIRSFVDRVYPPFSCDMIKQGWCLVENITEPREVSIADLEVVPFLKEGEVFYNFGERMRERAKNLGANLGQYHAEYILVHQNEIPREWQSYYFLFPGTVWSHEGVLSVPCLVHSVEWKIQFVWIDIQLFAVPRLLRPRK